MSAEDGVINGLVLGIANALGAPEDGMRLMISLVLGTLRFYQFISLFDATTAAILYRLSPTWVGRIYHVEFIVQ